MAALQVVQRIHDRQARGPVFRQRRHGARGGFVACGFDADEGRRKKAALANHGHVDGQVVAAELPTPRLLATRCGGRRVRARPHLRTAGRFAEERQPVVAAAPIEAADQRAGRQRILRAHHRHRRRIAVGAQRRGEEAVRRLRLRGAQVAKAHAVAVVEEAGRQIGPVAPARIVEVEDRLRALRCGKRVEERQGRIRRSAVRASQPLVVEGRERGNDRRGVDSHARTGWRRLLATCARRKQHAEKRCDARAPLAERGRTHMNQRKSHRSLHDRAPLRLRSTYCRASWAACPRRSHGLCAPEVDRQDAQARYFGTANGARRQVPYTNPEYLVTAQELAANLDAPNLRIFDATVFLQPAPSGVGYRAESGLARFQRGHVPGAAFLDLIEAASNTGTGLGFSLPPPSQLQALFRSLGIDDDSEVVLYSTGHIMWATRAWWLFRYCGHGRARVLNGGFKAWRAGEHPVSTKIRTYPPGGFTVRPVESLFADKEAVLAAIADAETCTVNALSPEVHAGEGDFTYGRRGHIAGSVNVYYDHCSTTATSSRAKRCARR